MAEAKRSRGAVALVRVGKTKTQVATEVGVSTVSAHYWMTGKKRPDANRRVQLRERYGIAEQLWEEYPADGEATTPSPASAAQPSDPVIRLELMARQLMDELQAELDKPIQDRKSSAQEIAKSMSSITPILTHLAKLQGQYDLSRKIFSTPTWQRIETELTLALEAFPDAAQAVSERFKRLHEETTAS